MYTNHFQMQVAPFNLGPQLDFRFKSSSYVHSLQRLQDLLAKPHPLTVLVGAMGTGKTLVLHSLLADLPTQFEFVMVANTLINARDLVKLVLADLDVTFARHLDQKMLVKIYRTHIKTAHAAGRTIVIAIDEAQNLDPDVLRSLKDLLVAADGSPLPVKIILSGQLALSEHLLAAQLLTVAGLKARSYQLKPLSAAEVDRYLHYRTSIAGNKRRIFQKNAVKRIGDLSDGVPRVINALAANGLQAAYRGKRKKVRPEDIVPLDSSVPDPESANPLADQLIAKSASAGKTDPRKAERKSDVALAAQGIRKPEVKSLVEAVQNPKVKTVAPSLPKTAPRAITTNSGDDPIRSFVRRTIKSIPEIQGIVILHGRRGVLAAHLPVGVSQSDLIGQLRTFIADCGDVSEKILDSTCDYAVIRSVDGVFVAAPVMADTTLALYTEGTSKLGLIMTKLGVWRQELRLLLKEDVQRVG